MQFTMPVTLSLSSKNTLLSTLLSDALSEFGLLRIRDFISHLYKTTVNTGEYKVH
jgi:hypothetical protein